MNDDRKHQRDLLEDRRTAARLLRVVGLVILGEEDQQRMAVEMLIDMIKTDHWCARRMLRVFEGDKRMAMRFPELKKMCETQVQGPIQNPPS